MMSGMSLFWRVYAINTGLLVVAAVALALGPATISDRILVVEAAVLAVGVAVVLAVNLLLLRRVFDPLQRLTGLMRRIEPLAPGQRLEVDRPAAEVGELCTAFNDLLDRLEHERRDSARRALDAQEDERRRLARELHDQVGQTLTGVALQLDTLAALVPGDLRPRVQALEEAARGGVEEVREIARGLRPEALDDFGLRSALVSLGSTFTEQSRVQLVSRVDRDLPELDRDDELVVYRVAQESLTNVARHANASRAELSLQAHDGAVVLAVRDDGCGIDPADARDGVGVRGMRERAMLVGGRLDISTVTPHGTEVRLALPAPSDP